MECMYCGHEFDSEGTTDLFDELLAHLEEDHPEVVAKIEDWPAYQDYVKESSGE